MKMIMYIIKFLKIAHRSMTYAISVIENLSKLFANCHQVYNPANKKSNNNLNHLWQELRRPKLSPMMASPFPIVNYPFIKFKIFNQLTA